MFCFNTTCLCFFFFFVRGHPLCEFCDTRYVDSDELFRHLRRDHLYCHFCDADGKHEYYNSYEDLRNHFLEEHYLCEEGECKNEKFTSVFRTDIDLKGLLYLYVIFANIIVVVCSSHCFSAQS